MARNGHWIPGAISYYELLDVGVLWKSSQYT